MIIGGVGRIGWVRVGMRGSCAGMNMKNPAAFRERGVGSSILRRWDQPTRHRPGGPVIVIACDIATERATAQPAAGSA